MTFFCKLHIKVEYDESQDKTHFAIRKTDPVLVEGFLCEKDDILSSKTTPRTKVEGLKGLSAVIHKFHVSKKSLGMKRVGFVEILFSSIQCPVVDGDIGLRPEL